MNDAEYVLRFLTLQDRLEDFSGNLVGEMTDFMRRNRLAATSQINQFEEVFVTAMSRCEGLWGDKAFRRPEGNIWRDQTLAGMYDAQMIAASRISERSFKMAMQHSGEILSKTRLVFEDADFNKAVRTGTNTQARSIQSTTYDRGPEVVQVTVSRCQFYSEIRAMIALSANPLLTDVFPPSDAHNSSSRILRRGLAVASFSLLESYLEDRVSELTDTLTKSPISYSSFSLKLRRFLTVEAVLGLANRISTTRPAEQQQQLVDMYLPKLTGYSSSKRTFTGLGFSPRGSNVSRDDVKTTLSAFGIEDGWGKLLIIAKAIGFSRINLSDDYQSTYIARNNAAHEASFNIPTIDLQTHLDVIANIGICFDVLATSLVNAHVQTRNSS